jgi:sugar transferase EpsL
MDIFFGFIIFILLLPILLLLSFFVFFSMGRPIFFKQERIGKNNKPFIMYKFRTMREPKEGESRLLSDADRVTKVGAFLRKTSLDELPEIINVIKGEMSLVGPRPLLAEYLKKYSNYEKKRHLVKPGITGLAQVNPNPSGIKSWNKSINSGRRRSGAFGWSSSLFDYFTGNWRSHQSKKFRFAE